MVQILKIKAFLNPDPEDMLNENQLAQLRNLVITNLRDGEAKILGLL